MDGERTNEFSEGVGLMMTRQGSGVSHWGEGERETELERARARRRREGETRRDGGK